MVDATSVATLMEALANRGEKADQSARNQVGILEQQAELENTVANTLEATAQDAKLIAITSGAGLLAAQAATSEAKRLLEGDTLDHASLKAQQMVEFVQRKRESDIQLQEIKDKSSVSFFDNPLEYIVNQMDLPRLTNQYNMTAVQANSALRTVNDIDSTLTNEAQANKATAVTQTTASVAAASRVAANAYSLQASEAEYKALGLGLAANQIVDKGNAVQIDMLMQQYQILNNEDKRKQQELEYRIQQQRFDQWLTERKDSMEAKQFVRGVISTGMGVLGMRKPDDSTLNAYEQLYKTPEGRKEIAHIIDAGQRKIVTGLSLIGTSPADAMYTVASVGDYSKGKEYEPALAAIKSVADQLVQDKARGLDPRKPDTFKPALNAAMNTIQKQWNIDPENSPVFKAPTMERMAQVDVVAKTPWFGQIIAPSLAAAKANGSTVPAIPAKKIYEQTMAAVDAGNLSLEQAAFGIATYYTMAGKINAIKNGQVGIGPQQGYQISVGDSVFASKVDLTKPEQVLNKMLQSKQYEIYGALDSLGLRQYRTFNVDQARPDNFRNPE